MVVTALPLWRARGPRFLLLLAAGWIGLRLLFLASSGDAPPPLFPPQSPPPVRWDEALTVMPSGPGSTDQAAAAALPRPVPIRAVSRPAQRRDWDDALRAPSPPNGWNSPLRHRWRLEMLKSLFPHVQRSPVTAVDMAAASATSTGQVLPPMPAPLWPTGTADRWSLAVYSQWRGGGSGATLVGNRPPALGGSQSGARLDYRLDGAGRWRGFMRLTASPVDSMQADVALGLTLRPKAALPVEIHVEQRFAVAGPGRSRTLAYASGGVDERPLAAGFRLSAYAQGGIAGPNDIEGFADGAMVVDRPVWGRDGVELSLGAVLAGAVQRDAARIDIGPRATLSLPQLGEGTRVALDWRERVAGNARPGSGAVLTLSAGF
jgi:hypothetical protein